MSRAPGDPRENRRDAERGGFLARWSQRKQALRTAPQSQEAVAVPPPPQAKDGEREKGGAPLPVAPSDGEVIDPATLPDPETLGAGDDFSPFLRKGVPEALKAAALRRMWRTDPFISTFREMADYDWDFNAPGYQVPLSEQEVAELLDKVLPRAAPSGDAATPMQAAAAPSADPSPATEATADASAAKSTSPEAQALPQRDPMGEVLRLSQPASLDPRVGQAPCDQPAQPGAGVVQPALTVAPSSLPPSFRPRRHGGAIPA